MKFTYSNQQEKNDPFNGPVIVSRGEFSEWLEKLRTKRPFFIRLSCDDGFEILFGIAGYLGCVQHRLSYGESTNLMAVSRHPSMMRGHVEFLTANTLTPVAARYIISFDELKEVVLHFLQTGERSGAVGWQKLNHRALKEDAERPAGS